MSFSPRDVTSTGTSYGYFILILLRLNSCDVSAGNLKNSSSEGGTKVGLFIMQNDRCLDFNSFSVYSNTF